MARRAAVTPARHRVLERQGHHGRAPLGAAAELEVDDVAAGVGQDGGDGRDHPDAVVVVHHQHPAGQRQLDVVVVDHHHPGLAVAEHGAGHGVAPAAQHDQVGVTRPGATDPDAAVERTSRPRSSASCGALT